jgi:hypothetical protein
MARTFSPFTRLTLLVAELNGNKLEDLTDIKKCDLLYHTSKVQEGIEDPAQKQSAIEIGEQGKALFSSIKAGEMAKAEENRQALITSCKKLKDQV